MIPKAQGTKEKINWTSLELKTFVLQQSTLSSTIKKVKDNPQNGREYLKSYIG